MNILAQGVPGNTFAGFQRAIQHDSHKWVWWEEHHTPAFDVFDEFQPELIMLMDISRPMAKCIEEFQIPVVKGNHEQPFVFAIGDLEIDFHYLVDSHAFSLGEPNPEYQCDIGIMCEPNPLGLHLCQQEPYSVKVMNETAWPVSIGRVR
jgi:hypothetical protein